jgi:alpha-L-fucosidase
MKNAGIHPGLYYSWLDWSNKDYGSLAKWRCDDTSKKERTPENLKKWNRFIKFDQIQLKELCTRYKPDLLWFDGDWDAPDDAWDMKNFRKLLKTWLPDVTLNSRMKGYGDYATPEQGIPITPPDGIWELCMTMNSAWGYMKNDTKHKSVSQLIRIFIECISMGGNFLLNIGPKPDGTIRKEQVRILKEMGKWNHTYEEAIFDTIPGPSHLHYAAPSTISKDKKNLYLFLFGKPVNGILFKGLINTPAEISVMTTGETVPSERIGGAPWLNVPGALFIYPPENLNIGYGTVIKIKLNEPLKLYTGSSGAIEQN